MSIQIQVKCQKQLLREAEPAVRECTHVDVCAHVDPYSHSPTKARPENWVSRGTLVQRHPESPQGRTAKAMPLGCVGIVSVSSSTCPWSICTPRACCRHYRGGTASLQVGSVDKTDFQRYLTLTSRRRVVFSPYISLVGLEKPSSECNL